MFLSSCCCLGFFGGVLPLFLHIVVFLVFPKMLGKNYLLPRFDFESIFRHKCLFLVVLLCSRVFQCCFAHVLHICWGFHSRKCLAKILFLLGVVFEIHVWKQTFVFVVLLLPCVFRWCFAYVFAYLLGFSFPRMLDNKSLLLRLGF